MSPRGNEPEPSSSVVTRIHTCLILSYRTHNPILGSVLWVGSFSKQHNQLLVEKRFRPSPTQSAGFYSLMLGMMCKMKISPAISINKKCHSHQRFLASRCEWGLPKLWSNRFCHPPWWLLRSWGIAGSSHLPLLRWTRKQDLVPDSWGAYDRNEFSEPRGLHLPIQRMLNSLTWHLIFDVHTACSLCCKVVYGLTPLLLPPCSSFFSGLLRCCLLGLES